uniref:RE02040p n=1 Tax=Drosophila melanogaster TaxID=7227 RepID=Q8IR10_DROME|nr:TweedleY [Drosophila melanogaster]AAN09420.1 TweedleY [Drosophila melanogaster]AAT27277.1 RE02040p [Drosophila melanogaster]|eukprot:NP_728017.1 TweedleY [Drosophila melanogaster]
MFVHQVLVSCLILVALTQARPQYGYEQPSSDIFIGGGSAPVGGVGIGGSSGGGLVSIQPHRGGDKYLPPASTTLAPIINKKFYLVSAPEDHSNDGKVKHLVLGRPQKNYRVVFIKAPAGDNANVKYSAEFAPQEEKTVIYVLSKKDNDVDASDIATPAPTQPSKPEVFFIKYKTDDEAKQAQQEIQGQYDKLGGTNEYQEDNNAPITSVIGSLDGLNPDGSYNYRQIANRPPAVVPNSQYLPSLLKH